jgi:S1-C subfamily serine protease
MQDYFRRPGTPCLTILLAVALLGRAADACGAEPSKDSHAETPAVAAAAVAGDSFEDPEAIAKIFSSELAKLAKRETLVSPEDLVEQAKKEQTCLIDTLADRGEKLTAEAVYALARRSVVIVGGINKSGKARSPHAYCASGFVIRKDGVIVTNFHVLSSFEQMKAVGVMTAEGRLYPIQSVLAADRHNDVAVLKVAADNLPPLALAGTVPVGATVYCLSHPVLNARKENGFYSFTAGIVSGKFRLRIAEGTLVNVLAITADYATGSSGGPILNEHGAVVAMVCQTLPIYHDQEELDVQMIWKFTRPTSSILPLLAKPPAAAKPPVAAKPEGPAKP